MLPKFVPHDGPQIDYFITTQDNPDIRNIMLNLGASCFEKDNYTAYVWNPRFKNIFLSGAGVLDSDFQLGPRPLSKLPHYYGTGNYNVVQLLEDGARVIPDPFGMLPTYQSDHFVTNRLHLAAIVSKSVDTHIALSNTYDYSGFSFQLNTLNTPIEGVSLVEAGNVVVVDGSRVISKPFHLPEFPSQLSKSDYWSLIEKGAEELVKDITAIVESGMPVYTDITGGKDSRLVFGAIVAAGKQEDVIFNTIPNPTTPGLKTDLEIGTGLVAKYGGNYGGRPTATGYSHHTVSGNLLKRRSQVFGTYHWIVPSDISPVKMLTKKPSIRVMGGGGEVYRDRWHFLLFNKIDLDEIATEKSVYEMLVNHQPSDPTAAVSQKYFALYQKDIVETIMAMPGETLGHKIDSHFLNFRNRYHFAQKTSSAEAMFPLSLANSPSLITAYRGLPAAERQSGRVPFDLMSIFDEKLPYYPFDKPLDPQIFKSDYHRKSLVEDISLDLPPHPELAQNVLHSIPGIEPPLRPISEPIDFSAVLDNEIAWARDVLESEDSIFDFLDHEDLDNLIKWSCERSIAQKSAIASKLTAFADYSTIANS